MNKIGLVLSDGGARGFAHLGLLKLMDELNVKISAISGVSAGAIFGALYASGKTPHEIIALAKSNSYFGFSSFLWRKEGLFSFEAIRKALKENLPDDSFESLKIPLFVNATDILHNKSLFFSTGELIERLIASASVPVIFEPIAAEDTKLVDGGLLNNFPIEPLVSICDKIIGSHVNKLSNIADTNFRFSKAAMIERSFHMAVANSVYTKLPLCDVFVEPDLEKFGLFRIKDIDQIVEIGYKAASQQKDKIITLTKESS